MELGGHSKAVLCLSAAPQGNRVITGSIDYSVKIFDFGGMDRFVLSSLSMFELTLLYCMLCFSVGTELSSHSKCRAVTQ